MNARAIQDFFPMSDIIEQLKILSKLHDPLHYYVFPIVFLCQVSLICNTWLPRNRHIFEKADSPSQFFDFLRMPCNLCVS